MSWIEELGMKHNPFDKGIDSSTDVLESGDLIRMQDAITEAVYQRQMLIILGPRGGGKTTTCYDFLDKSPANMMVVKDIALSIESLEIHHIEEAIIRAIIKSKGSTEKISKSSTGRNHQITRLMGEFQKQSELVLVLEDGHKMKGQTLINLKRLRELRFAGKERLLTIIILAQPQMRTLLSDYEEVMLRSKILELNGLDNQEVEAYLELKFSSAGVNYKELFDKESVRLIRSAFHWPLEINHNMIKILNDAYETGQIPITAEIVKKYTSVVSQLKSLWVLSGLTLSQLTHQVKKVMKDVSRKTVEAVLNGYDTNEKLEANLRKILIPFTGEMSVLYDRDLGGLTKQVREILEGISQMIYELGDNLDMNQLARNSGFSQKRFYEIITGNDVGVTDANRVKRELERIVKSQKRIKAA